MLFVDLACGDDPVLKARLASWLKEMGGEPVAGKEELFNPRLEDPELLTGCLGDYRLVQKLGEGGFGTVYLAEQNQPVNRRVALKILKPEAATREIISRFEAERQALALMEHPNIAKVLDAGETRSGRPFLVMELVPGEPITTFCDRNGLETCGRLGLFVQVCEGVQHAHQKGVIHRDIKPSNILVATGDDRPIPKIIDFGIAKAILPGPGAPPAATLHQFIGTPAYLSPEHVLTGGHGVDTRSDIYSLGVLLYELLVGETPFQAGELLGVGLEEFCRVIKEREPVKPSVRIRQLQAGGNVTARPTGAAQVPVDLDWVVLKCLQKDRDHRYATANGLAMDVRRFLNGDAVLARPPSVAYRLRVWTRRNRAVAILGSLFVIGLSIAAAVGNWMALRLARAKEATDQANSRLAELVRRMEWENMERLVADGRRTHALPWFARTLRENPHDVLAASRVLSLLSLNSFALPESPPLVHAGRVVAVQLDSDAARLLTACSDRSARVWDVRSGREIHRWTCDSDVTGVAFARQGRRIVIFLGNSGAQVRDADTGDLLIETQAEGGAVPCVLAEGDRWLVVFGANDSATTWDLDSGLKAGDGVDLPRGVVRAAGSPRACEIALALATGGVWIGDALTGRTLARLRPFRLAPSEMAFTPDGQALFLLSPDRKQIAKWRRDAVGPVEIFGSAGDGISLLAFMDDGRRFGTWAYSEGLRIWNAESLDSAVVLMGGLAGIGGFCFGGSGLVGAHNQFGMAVLLDAEAGSPLLEPIEHPSPVISQHLNSAGFRMATGTQGGVARVWDVQMRRPPEIPFPTNGSAAVEAEFSPDGSRVLLSTRIDALRVFDARTGEPVSPSLEFPEPSKGRHIWRAGFSADGTLILAVCRDGEIQIWDARAFRPVVRARVPPEPRVAQFSPDGMFVVTGDSTGVAHVLDSTTGDLLADVGGAAYGEVASLDIDPRSRSFMTAHAGGAVQRWTLPDGEPFGRPIVHGGTVWHVEFSPDGRRAITASADRSARVWDVATGLPISRPMRHDGEVLFACFSPDGALALTTSKDGFAQVWDASAGSPVSPLIKLSGAAWQGSFSPDGQTIATGCMDGACRIWDIRSGLPLTEPWSHPDGVVRLAFSADGRRLLTYGGDRARIWEVVSPPVPVPSWFCDLIEGVAGARWGTNGASVSTSPEIIHSLRARFSETAAADFYSRWARWFLVERTRDFESRFQDGPGL